MDAVKNKCGCPCHKSAGLAIVVLGVLFLLQNLGVLPAHIIGMVWPVLIILAGLKITLKGMCKCCEKG